MSKANKHVNAINLSMILCTVMLLSIGIVLSLLSGSGVVMAVGIAATVVAAGVVLFCFMWTKKLVDEKIHWYVDMLDAIPFPLSVTDNNMIWTFVNKPVEGMLGKKREDLIGKHCSNWGAGICKTSNCGIDCLRRNTPQTTFDQFGMHFQVDTAYLRDTKGNKCGHIEVVQDITKLNSMARMQGLFAQIDQITDTLEHNASNLSGNSQTLAQGATEQAGAVEQLTKSVAEVSKRVKDNAENTAKANEMAITETKSIDSSNEKMQQLMEAMNGIQGKSAEISKIIKTIQDIAFQTNMLALNASVEAARAGAAGRGFAVVADEVRNLAGKSAQAASNTTKLIEDSVKSIDDGVRLAQITAEELHGVVENVKTTTNIISEISNATQIESEFLDSVSAALDQIYTVVQVNSANSEQSAAASIELSEQAALLKQLLDGFRNNEQQLRARLN